MRDTEIKRAVWVDNNQCICIVSIVSKLNASIECQCAVNICRDGSTLHCRVAAEGAGASDTQ